MNSMGGAAIQAAPAATFESSASCSSSSSSSSASSGAARDAANNIVEARKALNNDERETAAALSSRLQEGEQLLERELGEISRLEQEAASLRGERSTLQRDVSDAEDALKRHRLDR